MTDDERPLTGASTPDETPDPREPDPGESDAADETGASGDTGETEFESNLAPRETVGDAVLTRRGTQVELGSAACFVVAMLAAIALAVVYWQGGQPQAEGILLAISLGGIGVGIVLWAKHFMPDDEVAEERHSLASTEEEVAAFTADFQAGESSLRSRRILVATAGGACAALGVAIVFPIRSLGPRPGRGLKETAYRGGGMRVVREDGSPVRPTDLEVDGFITVWPEGHTDAADAPTLLIRYREDQGFTPREGREDWTVRRRRRLLKDLHARRLSGGPLPVGVRPVAVPVPPVDLRRDAGRQAGVRAGRGVAAAAAARRRRRGLHHRHRRLLRPRGAGLLGPGTMTS